MNRQEKKQIAKEKREDKQRHKIPLSKYTKGGKASTIIGIINLWVIVLAVVLSYIQKGQAGIYVGAMMLMVFVSAAVAFGMGINSFREENKFMRYTYVGTIINAVLWIGILGMYLIYV